MNIEDYWMKTKAGGKVRMDNLIGKSKEELQELQIEWRRRKVQRANTEFEESNENNYIKFLIKKLKNAS